MGVRVDHRIVGGVEQKWCNKCKQWLSLDDFVPGSYWDHLYPICKACKSAYNHKYREEHSERVRKVNNEWRATNADRVRRNDRKWYTEHHEEALQKSQEWKVANPGYQHDWYLENREWAIMYRKEWQARHPGRASEYSAKRRSLILGVDYEACSRQAIYERDKGVCQKCGKPIGDESWAIDHFIPISRGGHTIWDNLRLLHARCNSEKHAKMPTHEEAQAWLATIRGWSNVP